MSKNIVLEIESFLDDESCNILVDIYNKDDKEASNNFEFENFWKGRVCYLNRDNVPETIHQKIYSERLKVTENYFEKKLEFWGNCEVVYWPTGYKMTPHKDYGTTNEFIGREYTSMIYLNDDYEGGELILPQHRLKFKPKKGTMICFQGGIVWHGVAKVTKGVRYTCPAWFKIA